MSKAVNSECYKLKESLPVQDYKVQELPTNDHGSNTLSNSHGGEVRQFGRRVMRRDSSRWTHSFLLVHHQHQNVYTIFARTAEDKLKVMHVEKYYKRWSRFLRNNDHFFRQINVFSKEVTLDLISRNFLSMIARISKNFSIIYVHTYTCTITTVNTIIRATLK